MEQLSELEKFRAMSDDELLTHATGRQRGDRWGDAALLVLQTRREERLAESVQHLEDFAARTEASGKRMEWATYIILLATVVQLALAFWPAHK